jgi:hypothetical protein
MKKTIILILMSFNAQAGIVQYYDDIGNFKVINNCTIQRMELSNFLKRNYIKVNCETGKVKSIYKKEDSKTYLRINNRFTLQCKASDSEIFSFNDFEINLDCRSL